MKKLKRFTVFTPTFNRAHLIHRVFDSLTSQSFRDFEWIIIDDGSTDNTENLINSYIENSDIEIRYIKKENAGKVSAINDALLLAKSEWFIVFDSDDWCDNNALELIDQEINSIPDAEYASYGAVSVLKRGLDGCVIGDDYSKISKYGKSYVDRLILGIKGDKWEIIKTDIHRKYRYELQENEKYMAPSYSWLMLSSQYKTIFVNKDLSTIEYQEDGISRNNIKHRVGSSNTTAFYYKSVAGILKGGLIKNKMLINYYRFKMHSKQKNKLGFLSLLASFLYFFDLYKMRKLK